MSRTDLPDAPIVLARAGGKVLLKAEDRITPVHSRPTHGADLTDFLMGGVAPRLYTSVWSLTVKP